MTNSCLGWKDGDSDSQSRLQESTRVPYPYALNECYDVYQTLMTSRGRCLGFSGQNYPRIVILGKVQEGNLARV